MTHFKRELSFIQPLKNGNTIHSEYNPFEILSFLLLLE